MQIGIFYSDSVQLRPLRQNEIHERNWLTEEVTFYPIATDKYFQILQHFLQFITLGRWCIELITKRITKKPFSRKITGWISSKPNLDFHNLKTVYSCERLDWLYCVQLMHSRNATSGKNTSALASGTKKSIS